MSQPGNLKQVAKPRAVVQRAISSADALSTPVDVFAVNLSVSRPPIKFILTLLDDELVSNTPTHPMSNQADLGVRRFVAGQTYHLRLYATSSGPSDYKSHSIYDDIELALHCADCPYIHFQDHIPLVSRDALDGYEYEFTLEVDELCPYTFIEINLKYRPIGAPAWWLHAANPQRLEVEGSYSLPDPHICAAVELPDDGRLPSNIAVLSIESIDDGKSIHVVGCNSTQRELAIDLPTLQDIQLTRFNANELRNPAGREYETADFVERGIAPGDVLGQMILYSRQAPPDFTRWLMHLAEQHAPNLSVVILDHIGYNFPWEMLVIDDQSETYLGTKATISRWLPANMPDARKRLRLNDTEDYVGDVLAYLDPQLSGVNRDDRLTLAEFITVYCESSDALKNQLKGHLDRFGLIYLGCHGMFSFSDDRYTSIGSPTHPADYICYLSLEGPRPTRTKRPLLFSNSCHSGRLKRGAVGLPEVLLARDAGGYIGTLGPVGIVFAGRVIQRLVERLCAEPDGVRLSEFLRALRDEAIQQYWSNPGGYWMDLNVPNDVACIFAFMYVYFGSPFARLKLHRVTAGGESAVEVSA